MRDLFGDEVLYFIFLLFIFQ